MWTKLIIEKNPVEQMYKLRKCSSHTYEAIVTYSIRQPRKMPPIMKRKWLASSGLAFCITAELYYIHFLHCRNQSKDVHYEIIIIVF